MKKTFSCEEIIVLLGISPVKFEEWKKENIHHPKMNPVVPALSAKTQLSPDLQKYE